MSKPNDFDIKRKRALRWGYFFVLCAVITFVIFLGRILDLQNNSSVEKIKEEYINSNYREATLKAARGNLYASDGSILATTVMRYDIYIDFKTIADTTYTKHIGELSDSLGSLFDKPKSFFRQKFDQQRQKKNQYYSLARGLDFDQYDRIRKFPIFKKGKNKGGFIVDRKYKRELATSEIGAGTIGMDDERGKSGLEAAFSKYLKGTDGTRLEQRVNSSQWKPIDYWKAKEPIDGEDVYTTLDLRIQDIVHTALEKQLIEYNADHGSVIVMEVETGKIRAMVNLRRTEPGVYADAYNYSLKDATEPGSTFKTISLLAAMDDGFIDEKTTVNIGDGRWNYFEQSINDSHVKGNGVYDISDVLAESSNVGASKIITKHYGKKPKIFIEHLKKWKLFEKMDIEIPGITRPTIITPDNPRWSKGTLASLSFGYASAFNILQLTTFYNGIANNGKMVKPIFIDKIMKDGKVIYSAKPQVIVDKMASPEAIQLMTKMLVKTVEKGTAKSIYTPNLKIAGKTGTARWEYWKGPGKYQSAFSGFYPADQPKYTCYVAVNQPDTQKGYAGAVVAAPVFKEIAGKTFLKTPQNIEKSLLVEKKNNMKKLISPYVKIKFQDKKMPNVVGLIGKNTIPQLENFGYRVEYKGVGKIKEQFPVEGTIINKNQRIYLTLQN